MLQRKIFAILLCVLSSVLLHGQSFKSLQQKAPRVKSAYSEKWAGLHTDLVQKGYDASAFEMIIRIFKHEKQVELWLRSKGEEKFTLFRTYNICYYSGNLGPKRKQGDGQVPEGFYTIAVFNPYSSYHLSLGINYPNACDRIISKANFGGDIMIHGNCVSIGCIPITDTFIKELYLLAVEAKNDGQSAIPVYIFPCRMNETGIKYLNEKYSENKELLAFWKNIKSGYDIFEKNKQSLKISSDKAGNYVFQER